MFLYIHEQKKLKFTHKYNTSYLKNREKIMNYKIKNLNSSYN